MSVVPPVNPQWFTTQRESPSKISAAGQKAAVSAASVPFVVDAGRLAASSAPPTGSFEDFRECLHWKATDKIGNTSVVARHLKRRLNPQPSRNHCNQILQHWFTTFCDFLRQVPNCFRVTRISVGDEMPSTKVEQNSDLDAHVENHDSLPQNNSHSVQIKTVPNQTCLENTLPRSKEVKTRKKVHFDRQTNAIYHLKSARRTY
eukprot:GHVT01095489.1.p1 GENE.GHVT01095489.1~~GHVT01095489.1.p1  ORF type:complete len:203 (-),score=5.26 GHVT01095489.1:683-1291(-)